MLAVSSSAAHSPPPPGGLISISCHDGVSGKCIIIVPGLELSDHAIWDTEKCGITEERNTGTTE